MFDKLVINLVKFRYIFSPLIIYWNFFIRFISILINGFWALPTLAILFAIKPWLSIEIRSIYSYKLGHFVVNAHEELNLHTQKSGKVVWFFFHNPREIANKQWAAMVKRNLPVKPYFAQYLAKWLKVLAPNSGMFIQGSTQVSSRYLKIGEHNWSKTFTFTEHENTKGFKWLESQGWIPGHSIVSLVVRDSSYYQNAKITRNYNFRSNALYEQSYRNSDIQAYLESVEYLIQKGVFVIRMGSIAESPLNLTHPLFIDYPFLNNKSDFLDIWIIANSRAVISTSTGLDSLACIYKIPQLTVNFLPLTALYSYCNSVSVPKNIFNLEKEKKINLKEYLNLGGKIWPTQSNFDKLPIRISNLTSLELLKATQEFWARIEGTHNSSDTDLILQNKFWTAFKSHPDYKYNHNWKHPKAFVGEDWLRSQEEDFFE